MSAPQVHATVDFSRTGKQLGQLLVPADAATGHAEIKLPVGVVAQGSGPTALIMATGLASPGQIATLRLMRELEEHQVAGTLILLPATSEATEAAPGELVSEFLAGVLFPLADIVIELHGGQGSLRFHPCAHLHLVDDRPRRTRMVEGTLAWNTDFAFLDSDSLLSLEAERQGKIVLGAEMAGEPVSAEVHGLAQDGLANVLSHFDLVQGCQTTRADRGLRPLRWLEAPRDGYRFAPESGLYEVLVPLGQSVAAGQPIGMIHFPAQPEREAQSVVAGSDGVLLATRAGALVSQGDCVACIAQEVAKPI